MALHQLNVDAWRGFIGPRRRKSSGIGACHVRARDGGKKKAWAGRAKEAVGSVKREDL